MKKYVISLSLLTMLSQPVIAAFQSGNELLTQCTSRDNAQFALCSAYLKATVDTLEQLGDSGELKGKKYCGLNRASVGQLADAFVSEARANPEKLSQGASVTVLSALDKAFSCQR